jgi:FAD/FMN-containing dehydrogenase
MVWASLSGWGRYPRVQGEITEPSSILAKLDLSPSHTTVTPRGQGRSYGDAALPVDQGLVIQTRELRHFLSFDAETGILKAEAGVTLQDILDVAIPQGWFLPVTPGTRFVSLGGAAAANIHGKNHHQCGAIAHCIQAIEILTEQGFLTATPEHNRDLFQATLGGFGLTGLIQTVTLSLKKIETSKIKARLIKVSDFEEALGLCKEHEQDSEYSVAWIDCLASKKNLGRGIVMLGNHATKNEVSESSHTLENTWKKSFSVPCEAPGFLLNTWTLKAFNTLYYERFRQKETERLMTLEEWFFPLDSLLRWNLLYGPRGFVQYQCVIPFSDGIRGMREILDFLTHNKIGSFLAVLKIVKQDSVLLPFAIPGYTLALDIPLSHPTLFEKLDALDKIVIRFGGRVYLAKDARLSPSLFRAMYPEYPQWISTVSKYSPEKRFYSLLAKRLQLGEP